MNGAWSIFLDQ